MASVNDHSKNLVNDLTTELNDKYAIPFKLRFKPYGDGLIMADITNAHASASICLQGGQLLSWQPVSTAEPVLWMSKDAQFAAGKSIRGGIPVCWPWFGAHGSESSFPAHGFARTQPWQVKGTRSLDDGSTELSLTMPLAIDISAAVQNMWPHQAQLDMLINVGSSLKIALITRNLGDADFVFTEALHTYFQVSDVAKIQVNGLNGCSFHDKAAGWTQGQQVGVIRFEGEYDRVYVNTAAACVIEDAAFGRRIHIAKIGSQSTVVWNPWAARAAQMGDLGFDLVTDDASGWKRFVCVESGNALENAVTVAAGKSHTLAVEYRVESI
jgi:D-hexose-6-phosphate mutarotase